MSAKENLMIFLNALKKLDVDAVQVVARASEVKLFRFNAEANKWIPTEQEGTLVFYHRARAPFVFGLVLLARDSLTSWNQHFDASVELQSRPPFLLYKSGDLSSGVGAIEGLWFPEKGRCEDMYKKITHAIAADPAFPSYAAMVTGPAAKADHNEDEGLGKRNLLDGLAKNEMEERSRAAEQAARAALRVSNTKYGACEHCGKPGHHSNKCWKVYGKPGCGGVKAIGAREPPYRTDSCAAPKASPVKRPLETKRQISQPVSSPPELNDSAILEISSSSSGALAQGPRLNRAGSPLLNNNVNLAALLHSSVPKNSQAPLSSTLHHSATFPSSLETVNGGTHHQPVDVHQASNDLRQFLRLPSVSNSSSHLGVIPAAHPHGNHAKSPSFESLDDTAHKFVRDVTEKLERVVGEGTVRHAEMALRPPQHFETNEVFSVGGNETGGQQLLLPQDMEIAASSNKGRSNGEHYGRTGPAREVRNVNPLTKEQLLQAMEHLLRTDRDFVGKIHQAYVQSLMENLKL